MRSHTIKPGGDGYLTEQISMVETEANEVA